MSNSIYIERITKINVHMSNGLTSVFLDVFGLSGSRLAKTEREKMIMVFVLEKNQAVVGNGTVGFDIGDMPWDYNDFDNNRMFVLSVIKGMKTKLGWETLDYEPCMELLLEKIIDFESLILRMVQSDINVDEINAWIEATELDLYDQILKGFPVCPKHNVFLTVHGCHVCTN
ncbi:hypothetical protein [Anaerosporobacter sp.]|uniref:hypothetical protein n=1 Tax=Anaerosporobacter sp. TaxID=1872529 RepID=UPI00286F8198|nr:hypothetical protein [Anaerosporobacter sp.]